jgi:hypothetical protein
MIELLLPVFPGVHVVRPVVSETVTLIAPATLVNGLPEPVDTVVFHVVNGR